MPKTVARPDSSRNDRQESDSSLEDIERELTRLVRALFVPRVHERLSERAGVSLERSAYGVLGRLSEAGALRTSELAGILSVDVSTVSRQVQDLESRGLLTRRPDPADGRATVLSLTAAGERVLGKIRTARREMMRAILSDWPADDRAELARLLSRFGDALAGYTEASR
jgi:DNA-binding MarR family transcriptional regulator